MASKPKNKLDSPLFIVVAILCVMGVVMVYSASSFKAHETYGDSNYFLKRHFYKVLAGFVIMLIVTNINYRAWLSISPALLLISFIILMYVLISPNVTEIRGSKRWIDLGVIQFQPSDFARLALILFLSLSLGASRMVKAKSVESFLFHLAVIAAIALPVILQPDIGSALMVSVIALVMLFVAGERIRNLAVLGLSTVPFLFYFLASGGGYRAKRISSFIAAVRGENVGWQAQQSLISFGSGHFFGHGLGGGRQKYHFLPDPFTDFIYSIFGEELGLLGTTTVLVLFVILIWSAFKIAMNTKEFQAKVLAVGLTFSIGLYAFTNMAVVLHLLPTTGVPLPFISYGGSALFTNMIAVGILLNIASDTGKAKSNIIQISAGFGKRKS